MRRGRLVVAIAGVALLAAACGSQKSTSGATTTAAASTTTDPVQIAQGRVNDAEKALQQAQADLTAANAKLCPAVQSYIVVLDNYSKLFTQSATTVGDVKNAGKDLAAPKSEVEDAARGIDTARTEVSAAQSELASAQQQLASASSSTTSPAAAPTTTTTIPPATIDRVKQAENDFAAATKSVTADTPLLQAGVVVNSAAVELQLAWTRLFIDAGCLTDQQQAQAAQSVYDYTLALQGPLQALGYYQGEVDGIYGPLTIDAVKALQKDAGLPQTGYVDRATAHALDQKVVDVLGASYKQSLTQTAAVQTILTLTGHWTGPIDGAWTPELTDALKAFQTSLGVPATGTVNPATIEAFDQALAKAKLPATPPTTTPGTMPPPTPSTTTTTTTAGASTTSTG
jgi:peptidoglycan hydrolase-like protein with peptidoglycan-binding domain